MAAFRLMVAGALALLFAATASADPARKVSVNELLATPMAFLDQPLVVSGVVASDGYGPKLCEFPAQRRDGHKGCIDLGGPGLTIPRRAWRYNGAVIVVEAYFSHLCYADVAPESEVKVEVICIHRGGNGWLTVESMRFAGAVIEPDEEPCLMAGCMPFKEVALDAPEAQGVEVFAQKVAAAWRDGDETQMLSLQLPSLRAETRWQLLLNDRGAAFQFGRPEFKLAPASVMRPGDGYRLFELTDPDDKATYHQLCFCVTGDCAEAWKKPFGPYAFQRHPIDCFDVWRSPKGWVLIY